MLVLEISQRIIKFKYTRVVTTNKQSQEIVDPRLDDIRALLFRYRDFVVICTVTFERAMFLEIQYHNDTDTIRQTRSNDSN